MLKKLLIRTWFGPLPPWVSQWQEAHAKLSRYGWDFRLITDLEQFTADCAGLGLRINVIPGTRKAGDFDPILGELYAAGTDYEWWGHCALDAVYGRLDRFLPDRYLETIDCYGNDYGAVCGPFTIYRNTAQINALWRSVPGAVEELESQEMTAFDEQSFSRWLTGNGHHIRFDSGFQQATDKQWGHHDIPHVRLDADGTLMDLCTNREIMMFHFNHSRRWPV